MDRLLRVAQTSRIKNNHSQDSVNLPEDAVVDVVSADYIDNYRLHLVFSDGKERIIDFFPFLKGSSNPMIRKYLDLDNFRNFTIQYGDLVWDDYDLCFPIADLYEGKI